MKTPRMLPKLLMLVVVFVTSLLIRTRDPQASLAKAGCQEMCGNIISIPYPFGIGAGCYMLESFEASCIRSSHDHVPLWFANDHEFPILEFPQILVHVAHESTKSRCAEFEFTYGLDTPGQYFSLSHERNLYVAVGCNITAYFLVYPLSGAVCKSLCNEASPVIGSPTSCTGFNGCCHLSIPKNKNRRQLVWEEQLLRRFDKWPRNNCRCRKGYKGKPYLPNGCQDVNACPKQSNHYCGEDETCVYTRGSYKCISPHHHKSNVLATLGIVIGLLTFGAIYLTYIKLDRIKRARIKTMFLLARNGS
uniref:Putative wall-associated receptor kinase, galacturonan-binding domain-containing protein n=1 Tax=Helianthus annuus TaxID=4232 RepID=A0A251V128_HELAN